MSRPGLRAACLLALAAMLSQGAANAAMPTAAEDAVSRTRIRAERQQANADYAAREAGCKQRFVVASCLNDAAVERRGILERLQEEEAIINERQRAARADIATRRVAEKQAAMRRAAVERETAARSPANGSGTVGQAARQPEAPADASLDGSGAAIGSGVEADAAKARKAPTPSSRKPGQSNLPSAAQRDKAKAEYDRRLEDAAKHRREVESRNAARALKKKPADPLPMLDAP